MVRYIFFRGCDVVLPIAGGTGDVIAHATVGATPSGDAYSRIMGVRGWAGGGGCPGCVLFVAHDCGSLQVDGHSRSNKNFGSF